MKCHRPLRKPGVNGLGPVCAKRAAPLPSIGRDLLGYDVPAAAAAAVERIRVHIEILSLDARMAIRNEAAAARRRLGVLHG